MYYTHSLCGLFVVNVPCPSMPTVQVKSKCTDCGSTIVVKNYTYQCSGCHDKRRSSGHHDNRQVISPRINKRKAFDECSPASKSKRREEGSDALKKIGVLPEELIKISPISLLPLPTSVRRLIRQFLPQLHLPSEKLIIREKLLAAEQKGTNTEIIIVGDQQVAMLSDPLKFINCVTNYSSFISIGIDKGNGTTKIGISYEIKNRIHYSALLVSTGDDTYEDLMELKKKLKFLIYYNN
jgi:hypothetical protein